MAWVAPVIGAVGSILGGALSGSSASSAQRSANETNIQLQKSQQAWEERMSNTAHTREVADYKAAGLNPMLSYTHLGGATTPNVSPAHVESTGGGAAGGAGAAIGPAVSSAWENYMRVQQATAMQLTNAQTAAATEKIKSETATSAKEPERVVAQTELARSSSASVNQDVINKKQEYENLVATAEKIRQETRGAKMSADLAGRVMELNVKLKAAEAELAALKVPVGKVAADAASDVTKLRKSSPGWGASIGDWLYDTVQSAKEYIGKSHDEARKFNPTIRK